MQLLNTSRPAAGSGTGLSGAGMANLQSLVDQARRDAKQNEPTLTPTPAETPTPTPTLPLTPGKPGTGQPGGDLNTGVEPSARKNRGSTRKRLGLSMVWDVV